MTKGKRGKDWAFFKVIRLGGDDDPYLWRLRVLSTPWFGLYLHRIYRPDIDRALHDHPYNFTSIILSGEYTEMIPGALRTWRRGSVHRMVAEQPHRITTVPRYQPCWTLLLVGRRRRDWGFHTEGGWVPWQEFLDFPEQG